MFESIALYCATLDCRTPSVGLATVDDLYIRGRVLAIAYSIAMRSSEAARIRPLADSVLETSSQSLQPHLITYCETTPEESI